MFYIKRVNDSLLFTDIIYALLGFLMIIVPEFISNSICYLIGTLLIIFGALKIANYVEINKKDVLTNALMIIGVVSLILGLMVIIKSEVFASIIPFILGIYIIIVGISKLQQALEFKKHKYDKWTSTLISASLLLVLGITIVLNPFSTLTLAIRIVGIVFMISFIYDAFNLYNYEKGFSELKKDLKNIMK